MVLYLPNGEVDCICAHIGWQFHLCNTILSCVLWCNTCRRCLGTDVVGPEWNYGKSRGLVDAAMLWHAHMDFAFSVVPRFTSVDCE